ESCLQAGLGGRCLRSPGSAESFCAFDSTTCSSGLAWGVLAGDGLARQCVVSMDGGSLSQDSPTMASGDGGPRPDGSQSPDGASAPDAPAGPHVFADPATLDFGTITQGANAMLPITLTNDGSSTTAAIVTHFTATGASGFSLVTDNCNGKMLDPQASCA